MNILLTSAGRRTYMIEYFKNALKGIGLIHASNSIFTYTLTQADKYVLTPNIYDTSYVQFLVTYCKNNDITAIISLFDIDQPVLAKNSEYFKDNGITLIVSDFNVTQICNDKWKTFLFLKGIGLKQTPTYISQEEAKQAIKDGLLEYPIFIKPRWGMGSIGIYKVYNDDELNVLYKRLYNEIFDTYLKYESSIDRESCIIIQQYIKGKEYGIEILNDLNKQYAATFAKRKIAMRSGETDIAVTVDPTPFEETAIRISKELKHKAILDIDCFVTESGDIYVLEMNSRFGGQYPFTHNAGVDIPRQITEWLQGKNNNYSLLTQRDNVISCKELVPTLIKKYEI